MAHIICVWPASRWSACTTTPNGIITVYLSPGLWKHITNSVATFYNRIFIGHSRSTGNLFLPIKLYYVSKYLMIIKEKVKIKILIKTENIYNIYIHNQTCARGGGGFGGVGPPLPRDFGKVKILKEY